jgi:hypothetical protein
MRRAVSSRRIVVLGGSALAAVLTACASSPAPRSVASSGASATTAAYPGPCSFVALEAMEQPSPGRGATPDNLGTDTIELVATYRPSGGTQRRPVEYAFRVEEERVDDLRAHLEQQPEILCEGESAGRDVTPTGSATGPSFEGQPGRRLAHERP